jgi:hypothetical protein
MSQVAALRFPMFGRLRPAVATTVKPLKNDSAPHDFANLLQKTYPACVFLRFLPAFLRLNGFQPLGRLGRVAHMISENVFFNLLILFAMHFWWLILLIAGIKVLRMFTPKTKGRIGEGVVNLAAKLRLDRTVYHLLKDVTIPTKTATTQIDHVIVSKYGLFVIETKNYKGWIFADANDAKWTQVYFKQKHRFQNPLRQNYAHICALSELLGIPKNTVHGVVCFVGEATFKTPVPAGVFLEGRYVHHIESFQTPVFPEEEVVGLIQRIEACRLERGFKTNRAHVKQLNARRASSKNDSAANHSAKFLSRRAARK